MKPKGYGRVDCEVDDLIRLYKSKQILALQTAGERLADRVQDLMKESEPKWNNDYGTGMELGEQLILSAFCVKMRDYLLERESGKESKTHDKDCSLNGVI